MKAHRGGDLSQVFSITGVFSFDHHFLIGLPKRVTRALSLDLKEASFLLLF